MTVITHESAEPLKLWADSRRALARVLLAASCAQTPLALMEVVERIAEFREALRSDGIELLDCA